MKWQIVYWSLLEPFTEIIKHGVHWWQSDVNIIYIIELSCWGNWRLLVVQLSDTMLLLYSYFIGCNVYSYYICCLTTYYWVSYNLQNKSVHTSGRKSGHNNSVQGILFNWQRSCYSSWYRVFIQNDIIWLIYNYNILSSYKWSFNITVTEILSYIINLNLEVVITLE